MTLLYLDDCFLNHDTGNHPERAERLRAIAAGLARAGLDARCRRPTWGPVSGQRLGRVHAARYVEEVWALARFGGGEIDADTVVGPLSFDVALQAAGAACDAAARLLRGEDRRALCLVRPPGHHALVDRGMGFCLFNNVAVAARMAFDELQLDRVLVVDWDVHHGNGTQATFWEDPQVASFPSTAGRFIRAAGEPTRPAAGRPWGRNSTCPSPSARRARITLARFAAGLERLAAKIKPQLVLLSAGFDAHRLDPIGSLGLETEDYRPLTKPGARRGRRLCRRQVVSVLEGGYNPEVMAECVTLHLQEMLARE